MNAMPPLTRRLLLTTGGALVVSFAFLPKLAALAQNVPKLPGDLDKTPMLDSWIAIDAQGRITVFAGKAELGQGIKTALIQCAAEEIEVDPAGITLITADTERTPNEGYTAGSHSMQDCGTAILNAAAQVRGILIELAATRLNLPAEQLKATQGTVMANDGRSVRYGELLTGQDLHRPAQPTSPLKNPKSYAVIGKPMQRVVEVVLQLLSLGFFGILVIHGIPLVERTMGQLSSAIRIPMGYIYAAIPFGSALILLFAVEKIACVWGGRDESSAASSA